MGRWPELDGINLYCIVFLYCLDFSTHALQALMSVNNELTMTKLLIHYDVYVTMSCLS